jgi:hydrophobe/amphiphile efflux-1 (HAE1) family protein
MIRFFVARPIFACSIALLMVVAGFVALLTLPISQYPNIVPGTVTVTSSFPGASAEVVSDTVTTPLEQQINGVNGMIYMSSNSSTNGASSITVTFEIGYPVDIGAVGVLNRVQTALSQLPTTTQKIGVTIQEASPDINMVINLHDTTGHYDGKYLDNWAQINLIDALYRIEGVGSVNNVGGLLYSVRIWLDEPKLASMGIAVSEVIDAVEFQNYDGAIGIIGSPPTLGDAAFQYQLNALGQLPEVELFEEIVVRVGEDGQMVRIKDIGRAELGAVSYQKTTKLDGDATATIMVFQRPGTNALQLSKDVQELLAELAPTLPDGLKFTITHNNNTFVTTSMIELVYTLLEAIVLVVIVVFIFLQSWRTTLIPVIAIPVSLIATFAALAMFGFSINTLTLLGLVLAVGLVVDDAIVVVENVERQLESGLSRKEATLKAMREVTSPIIATTAVLMAVFIPSAFSPGITGQLYNQFALTIAFSVLISSFNSLSLSPALASIFLRHTRREDRIAPFRGFNRAFDSLGNGFGRLVGTLGQRLAWLVVLIFGVLLALTYQRTATIPIGFVPDEDQGYFFIAVQLPGGAALSRTDEACSEIAAIVKKNPNVRYANAIAGMDFLEKYSDTSAGFVVITLEPWSKRTTPESKMPRIVDTLVAEARTVPGVACHPLTPPPIPGLGSVGGFQFEILDSRSQGTVALSAITDEFLAAARGRPEIASVATDLRNDIPQLFLDIDRVEAQRLGLAMEDVWQTLQVYLGSLYVNNWNMYDQVYQVVLQAEGVDRMTPDDIGRLRIINRDGDPVPIAQFATVNEIVSTNNIPHYNINHSAMVVGKPAAGFSSGQAQSAMEQVAEDILIPNGFKYDWTGTAYQAIEAGDIQPYIFLLSLIVIFLVLSALYESWTIPLIIILSVPIAILGAVLALEWRGIALDVYGQIGLLMLFGLAAKNAILIVEFANRLRSEGQGIVEAAKEAARLRLRPILMTAFAFVFGVMPLALADGPGANARHSIGTTVIGGMIAATFLSLVIVPVLYIVIETAHERLFGAKAAPEEDAA